MTNILSALKGKKTYIVLALGVLTLLASHLGYITASVMNNLLLLEGFGSVATLRAALANIEDTYLAPSLAPASVAKVATAPAAPAVTPPAAQ